MSLKATIDYRSVTTGTEAATVITTGLTNDAQTLHKNMQVAFFVCTSLHSKETVCFRGIGDIVRAFVIGGVVAR